MEFDSFLVDPVSERFMLLRTAIETRLTSVIAAIVPNLLALQVSYRSPTAYIDPPERAHRRPLRIDLVTRDSAALLETFPNAIPPSVVARLEQIVGDYLRGRPYLVSLASSRLKLDRRLCRIPTDWLRTIIPRLNLSLALGPGRGVPVQPLQTTSALEHGDQHLLVDLLPFCDVPRRDLDVYPELETVTTMYLALREQAFSELCELHGSGALVDPPARLIHHWGLVPTPHKGVYKAAWHHSALVEPYDGMLGFLTHVLESEVYDHATSDRSIDSVVTMEEPTTSRGGTMSAATHGRVLIHLRCSPNRHARHHVAAGLRHLTGEAPQFRGSLVYLSVRNRTEALQAVTAVQTFEKIHQGAVEVRHSAVREGNLWSNDTFAQALADGRVVRYIDLDVTESRYAQSLEL